MIKRYINSRLNNLSMGRTFFLITCFIFILIVLPLFLSESYPSYPLYVQKEISLDRFTSDMIVDPDGSRIFLGISCDPTVINIHCDYGKISIINSPDFTVLKNITLPTTSLTLQPIAGPSIKVNSMIYNPNNNKIYVLISTKSTISEDENFIAIINGPSNILINKIIDLGTDTPADSTFDIMNMALNPAKNEIYVTNLESKTLVIVNSTNDKVTKKIPLDFKPDKIFYNNDKIYISDFDPLNKLSILESNTFTNIANILNMEFTDIAFAPELEKIFIASWKTSMINVINFSTFEKIGNFTTSKFPIAIVTDSNNNSIYLASNKSKDEGNKLLSVYSITNQSIIKNLALDNNPIKLILNPINKVILYLVTDKQLLKILQQPVTVTLTILEESSIQGNPDYDPDDLHVNKGDTIFVKNADTMPHTVTNGESGSDPNSGRIFDTSIISGGESVDINTSHIDPETYPFYCMVHPYMRGSLTIK